MAVQVGVKDLYYAILNTDSETGGVSYGTPVKMAKAINVQISPTTNTETLYADDAPSEIATALGEISVEINADDLPLDVQAALLGHTVTNGILVKNVNDNAPYVAVGFRSVKSNGKYRFIWMLKGKFTTPEQEYQTKEASPSFQTPTISGSFVKRDFDGQWQIIGDEDVSGFTQAATWFTSVPTVGADTTAPTVTVVPADGATSVAVGNNIVWTFSEAIQEHTVNSANFFVMAASAGTLVAGNLSLDATKKIVTFNPTTDLTAATAYIAVVTTNVKDLSGNSLAANSVTNFTTA